MKLKSPDLYQGYEVEFRKQKRNAVSMDAIASEVRTKYRLNQQQKILASLLEQTLKNNGARSDVAT